MLERSLQRVINHEVLALTRGQDLHLAKEVVQCLLFVWWLKDRICARCQLQVIVGFVVGSDWVYDFLLGYGFLANAVLACSLVQTEFDAHLKFDCEELRVCFAKFIIDL